MMRVPAAAVDRGQFKQIPKEMYTGAVISRRADKRTSLSYMARTGRVLSR